MSDYYCWYEYYWGAPVSKNIKSDERRYATGHVHGVQPKESDWAAIRPSLYTNVKAQAKTGAAYPGDATVLSNATKKTRSAH